MLSTARTIAWRTIPPHAAEYVAWLIEQGYSEEAAAVQRDQYRLGVWLALHGYPAGDYLPAATWQGYQDACR